VTPAVLTAMQRVNEEWVKQASSRELTSISYVAQADSFSVGAPDGNTAALFFGIVASVAGNDTVRLSCTRESLPYLTQTLSGYTLPRLNLTVKGDSDPFATLDNPFPTSPGPRLSLTIPTDLTMTDVYDFRVFSDHPLPIQSLTVIVAGDDDGSLLSETPNDLAKLNELQSMSILSADGAQPAPVTYDIALIFAVARRIGTLQTINGQPADAFDAEAAFSGKHLQAYHARVKALNKAYQKSAALSERASKLDAAQPRIDAAQKFYNGVLKKAQTGKYKQVPSVAIKGKAMLQPTLYVNNTFFYEAVVLGEKFWGVSSSKFTLDPKKADYVILIYPVYIDTGIYVDLKKGVPTGTGLPLRAYKTQTVVSVVDLKHGQVSRPHVVATENPPSTATSEADNKGEFLPDKAKAYVVGLL